jgi:hypothetical protein
MIREINFFGVYFAPFFGDFLFAFLLFLPLRRLCARLRLLSHFWHAALVELCLFGGVLTLTAYLA